MVFFGVLWIFLDFAVFGVTNLRPYLGCFLFFQTGFLGSWSLVAFGLCFTSQTQLDRTRPLPFFSEISPRCFCCFCSLLGAYKSSDTEEVFSSSGRLQRQLTSRIFTSRSLGWPLRKACLTGTIKPAAVSLLVVIFYLYIYIVISCYFMLFQ